jgi:hypothetical protein
MHLYEKHIHPNRHISLAWVYEWSYLNKYPNQTTCEYSEDQVKPIRDFYKGNIHWWDTYQDNEGDLRHLLRKILLRSFVTP